MSRSAKRRRPPVVTQPAAPAPTLHDALGVEPATATGPAPAPSGLVCDLEQLRALVDAGNAVDALRLVSSVQGQLDDLALAAVDLARGRGHTWADVGDALGVTRQAAWERYSC